MANSKGMITISTASRYGSTRMTGMTREATRARNRGFGFTASSSCVPCSEVSRLGTTLRGLVVMVRSFVPLLHRRVGVYGRHNYTPFGEARHILQTVDLANQTAGFSQEARAAGGMPCDGPLYYGSVAYRRTKGLPAAGPGEPDRR